MFFKAPHKKQTEKKKNKTNKKWAYEKNLGRKTPCKILFRNLWKIVNLNYGLVKGQKID